MYTIITDTCIDMDAAVLAQIDDIEVLPLSYTISGVTSTKPFVDKNMVHAFYQRLHDGEMCTTSQVAPGEFLEVFKKHAAAGHAMLAVIFSSGLSGTYTSACMARDMLLEEYPDAEIEVVDSLCASAGQGLIVYDVAMNRAAGMSLAENAKWIEENAQKYAQWFTVDDLNFLKRGGRCSPSAAFFGTLLKIKPVLHVNEEGKLIARAKVRGRKQALQALAAKFGELSTGADQVVFISHSDCEEDAQFVKDELVRDYGCVPGKIILSNIGPVIGSHTGPGCVALFFRARNRG